jgi:hypothetical protein
VGLYVEAAELEPLTMPLFSHRLAVADVSRAYLPT